MCLGFVRSQICQVQSLSVIYLQETPIIGENVNSLRTTLAKISLVTFRLKDAKTDTDLIERLANSYHGCGVAHYGLDQLAKAEEVLTKAINMYEEHGLDKKRKHISQHMLGQVHCGQGKFELAARELEDVIKVTVSFSCYQSV